MEEGERDGGWREIKGWREMEDGERERDYGWLSIIGPS